MAVVVLGALTSLALNMVVVPVLYMRFGTADRGMERETPPDITGFLPEPRSGWPSTSET
jgi:hypothetical protein